MKIPQVIFQLNNNVFSDQRFEERIEQLHRNNDRTKYVQENSKI